MTDRFLFVVSPYLTAAASLPGCIVRCVASARGAGSDSARVDGADASSSLATMWRAAFAVVAAGHLLAFAFPELVLRWNQRPARLLSLETVGLAAGIAALAALIALAAHRVRAPEPAAVGSPFDVMVWTLLLIEIVSGLAVAVFYRWGSSWSAVTIAPYLASLFRLDPDSILVARLPLEARLHLFCAFALLAAAPYSQAGRVLIAAVDRVVRRASTATWSTLPAWSPFDGLTARMQPLRVRFTRHEGEEN